jgi:hypothetical protein
MKLHGDIVENLRYAVQSAGRLREHRVHADTLIFWSDLLTFARQDARRSDADRRLMLQGLIEKLESAIAERQSPQP